jgi:hypothetical protein
LGVLLLFTPETSHRTSDSAFGLLLGSLVLNDIQVFDENPTLQANDVAARRRRWNGTSAKGCSTSLELIRDVVQVVGRDEVSGLVEILHLLIGILPDVSCVKMVRGGFLPSAILQRGENRSPVQPKLCCVVSTRFVKGRVGGVVLLSASLDIRVDDLAWWDKGLRLTHEFDDT